VVSERLFLVRRDGLEPLSELKGDLLTLAKVGLESGALCFRRRARLDTTADSSALVFSVVHEGAQDAWILEPRLDVSVDGASVPG
jgi:hypothetical protein